MRYQDESTQRGAAFLDQQAQKQEQPRLVSLEAGELLTFNFQKQEPLLGPWLRKQKLAMVHAWRGVGKTHFALGVAYAVASGAAVKWGA